MRLTPFQWRALARPLLLAMAAFTVVVAVRVLGEPSGPERLPLVMRAALAADDAPQGRCPADEDAPVLPPGHPPVDAAPRLPPGHPPVGPRRLPAGHPPVDGPAPMPVFTQEGTSTI